MEQDQLWAQSGVDEPTMLQHNNSPLTDGHPRHVQGGGGEESERGEESQAGGAGSGGGVSSGDSGGAAGHGERLEALQRQLEEQGRLLRTLCDQLEARQSAAA